MPPTLNDDIIHLILQAVDSPSDSSRRDQRCIDTLCACRLVCKTWRRLVQPIIDRVLIIDSDKHLKRRLLDRLQYDLRNIREVVLQQSHDEAYFYLDIQEVLRALPLQHLRSFICYDRAGFGGYHSYDALDRSLIGQARYSPPPLDFDVSNIREALLCNVDGGSNWTPFLLRTTKLIDLTIHQAGWSGQSCYANSPLYLPSEPAPFSLKRLEIRCSHIASDPLRWLLSSSADSLTRLSIWNVHDETFVAVSKLRAEGLLPKVTHVTFAVCESRGIKDFDRIVRKPLAAWQGLDTMCVYGGDSKCRAAIFNGISQLQPCPVIEMSVGDMKLVDFKALFRLRKGKLQPGTQLRLVLGRVRTDSRMGAYERWDENAKEHWYEREEEARELAEKHGMNLVLSDVSYYA